MAVCETQQKKAVNRNDSSHLNGDRQALNLHHIASSVAVNDTKKRCIAACDLTQLDNSAMENDTNVLPIITILFGLVKG